MLTLDSDFVINRQYQLIIEQQLNEVEKGQQKINLLGSEYKGRDDKSYVDLNNLFKKINRIFISQLISSKGLVYDIQQKQEILEGKNLSKVIGDLNELIKKNIEFNATVESAIAAETGDTSTELQALLSVVSETIEHFYKALRDLKKANKQIPVQTSDLAKNTALRSSKTLEKVMHGH